MHLRQKIAQSSQFTECFDFCIFINFINKLSICYILIKYKENIIIRINTSGVITGLGMVVDGMFVDFYGTQTDDELPIIIPTSEYGISMDINENIYIDQNGSISYNDSSYDSGYVRGKPKSV